MVVNTKNFTEMEEKDVFTDKGIYCGRVTDLGIDLEKFRVNSIVVDAVKGSFLADIVGNKKGVVIPFAMVKSIGDIILIKHISPTSVEEIPAHEEHPVRMP